MKKFLVLMFSLFALQSPSSAQVSPRAGTEKVTPSRCELSERDYEVFAGLLSGLGGPEHPEEAWQGREILIVDVTAVPFVPANPSSGWGFRSKSQAAPSPETSSDYQQKVHDLCTVNSKFGDPNAYRIIPKSELEKFFRKNNDGWKDFYQKYPKSAGYWEFSRPGYNQANDEALLYVSHSCGWLCGTGHLYLLSKQNGHWVVKNRVMLWIS